MSFKRFLPGDGDYRGRGSLGNRVQAPAVLGLVTVLTCLLFLGACSSGGGDRTGAALLKAKMLDPEVSSSLDAARTALAEGDYRGALLTVDSINRANPSIPDVWYLRGLILSEINASDSAKAAFLRVVALDPTYRGAYFQAGQVEFKHGRFDRAIELFRKERLLIEQSSRDARLFYREQDRTAMPVIHLQTGRAYQKNGRTDSARIAYDLTLSHDSLNATAHAWIAELDAADGAYGRALLSARKAVGLDPRSVEHRILYGSLLVKEKRSAEAVAVLEPAVRERPSDVIAVYNYSIALAALGRRAEADRYFDQWKAVDELNKATRKAEEDVLADPGDATRWITLADHYLAAGRYGDALHSLNVAVYLLPDDLRVRSDIANLHLVLGDTLSAAEGFQAIVRKDSTFADAWLNLGVVHAMQGDYTQARLAWQKVLKYNPSDPVVKTYLARLDD